MTPEQLDKAYTNTLRDMQSDAMAVVMARVGIQGLTLLRKRVQETGTDAKGSKYKPYSTKPMLTNCSNMFTGACSKVAGSKDKRRELQWVTIKGHKLFELPGGYKQYRELHGRQTNFVDFSFTNRMWDNIALISKQSDHAKGTAIIGARSDDNKKKLEGNTKRRGDILDLSNSEIDELKQTYSLGELQIFKNNGL
jgi:hypothetical protein